MVAPIIIGAAILLGALVTFCVGFFGGWLVTETYHDFIGGGDLLDFLDDIPEQVEETSKAAILAGIGILVLVGVALVATRGRK